MSIGDPVDGVDYYHQVHSKWEGDVVQLKPGWLARQLNNVAIEVATWPKSMRREGKQDDSLLTTAQRKEAARILRERADELDPQ